MTQLHSCLPSQFKSSRDSLLTCLVCPCHKRNKMEFFPRVECACGCGAKENLYAFKQPDGRILYSLSNMDPGRWTGTQREVVLGLHLRRLHEQDEERKKKAEAEGEKAKQERLERQKLFMTFKYSVVLSDKKGCTWRCQIEAIPKEPIYDSYRSKFEKLGIGTSSTGLAGMATPWGRSWHHWASPLSIGVYADVCTDWAQTGFVAGGTLFAGGQEYDFELPFSEGQKIYIKALRDHRERVTSALDDVRVARNLHVIVLQYAGLATLTESSRKYNE